MSSHREVCCTSPAALCYWCEVSFVAWVALAVIGLYWHPLHALSPATIFFAMAIGCFANFLRNRTFHCVITAPIFLLAGLLVLLSDLGIVEVNRAWLWPAVLIAVGVAFLLEWRLTRRTAQC